jgi:hypothetical protein
MKKTIITYLILSFLFPLNVEAKKKLFGNGLYWEIDNGVLTISGNGDMPDHTTTKRPWDNKKNKIIAVIILEGVREITGYTFFDHKKLIDVYLPSSIRKIGSCAFSGCDNLKHVKFSNGIVVIGNNAFGGCHRLDSIKLPNTIVEIGNTCFSSCKKIRELNIPSSVRKIGKAAFEGCNLINISIPQSVQEIGMAAFRHNSWEPFKYYDGTILCLPQFVDVNNALEYGLSVASVKRYYNSVRNKEGMVILKAQNDWNTTEFLGEGNKSYYIISSNEGIGLVNDEGRWVLPFNKQYIEVVPINNNYLKIRNSNYYGLISIRGKEIIPTSRGYTYIGDYDSSKGTFAFTKKGFSGVCDAQGREISTTRLAPTADDIKANSGYASAVEMKNGSTKYYKVSKGGRYGLTDSEGKEIIPCEMEALESAGTGYLKYKINGFWGLMNYAGKIIIDTDRGYTSIGDFKTFNKRFPYTMNGYKGECDINGRQISKIKVETPKQTVASSSTSSSSSSSSSSSNNNNSGNKTTTVVVEHHRDPVPVQEWQACIGCGGMGTMGCDNCGGSGTKYIGDRLHRCSRCNGRGIIPCNICYGSKGQYITVYR